MPPVAQRNSHKSTSSKRMTNLKQKPNYLPQSILNSKETFAYFRVSQFPIIPKVQQPIQLTTL